MPRRCAPFDGDTFLVIVCFLDVNNDPPVKPPQTNPFVDVKESDYFYEPVMWAVYHEPQITKGMTETTFGPSSTCTRGQIVTFLYRDRIKGYRNRAAA